MFIPKIGEDFQFDEHIFRMGWFNHQLVFVCIYFFWFGIFLENSMFVKVREAFVYDVDVQSFWLALLV